MSKHKNHDHPISVALREWADTAGTPNESAQAVKVRRTLAGGTWDKAAASPLVPVEIKQLMISHTDQKGTLYNILSDQRMPWEDLETIFEKVGRTAEAKFRLLKNRGSSLPFLLQFTTEYHKTFTPLLFSKVGIPVSAFEELMAEYGRQMEEWKKNLPAPSNGAGFGRVFYRSHELSWFLTAAQNWVAKHPDPYAVGKAILGVGDAHVNNAELCGTYFQRQDVSWETVKAVSGEGHYDNPLATGFFSVRANRVPIEELKAIATGAHEASVEGRVCCLFEGYKSSLTELVEALDLLLKACPHDELAEQIRQVGSQRLYGRTRRNVTPLVFTDGETPAEKFLLGQAGKNVTSLLGLFSFHYAFESIKDMKVEIEHANDPDSSAFASPRNTERVMRDSVHQLEGVIMTPDGGDAYREWLGKNYPELTEVPFDWVLEVLT